MSPFPADSASAEISTKSVPAVRKLCDMPENEANSRTAPSTRFFIKQNMPKDIAESSANLITNEIIKLYKMK